MLGAIPQHLPSTLVLSLMNKISTLHLIVVTSIVFGVEQTNLFTHLFIYSSRSAPRVFAAYTEKKLRDDLISKKQGRTNFKRLIKTAFLKEDSFGDKNKGEDHQDVNTRF